MSFSPLLTTPPSGLAANPFANLLRKHSTSTSTPPPRPSRTSVDSPLSKPLTFQETIGFSTLPDQIHRKTLKRGFEFTLMVVGTYRAHARAAPLLPNVP